MINFCTPTPHKNEENYKKYMFQFLYRPQMIDNVQILTVFVLIGSGEKDFKQVWQQKIGFRSQKLQKLVIFRNFRFSQKLTF